MSMAMNGETLDFKHIYQENRGAMHEGRLQLLNEKVVFKHSKTGKVDTMTPDDITQAFWRRVAKNFELKLLSKSGALFRFDGFHDSDFTKLKEFLQERYDIDLEEKELSAKGWNWGKADFKGDEMVFEVSQKTSFEIPLINVSQCTQSKDEVTLEFHQNEDTDLISLMEMRFYIPPSQDDDVDRVQTFHESVMAKADVLQVKGNAVCTFHDMKFLTPRGHYDVRMYPKFIQLHGKTYDYKITYTSILRLFLLPNKDQRQIFFVISLDPPLKQGQTRYHFLIMLFQKETELDVELALDDELKDRLNGKLDLEHSGPAHEVVSKVIRHLAGRKITVPGKFSGASGSQSITCSYKASSGILFPLPRGFMYVIKPPIHIRFDEISFVNFARGASSMNKSFDFEIETKNKVMHIFSNIEKGQYNALYDFVSQKGLRIKNIGKDGGGYNDNMKGSDDSDDDAAMHDPYMYRMKQEAAEKDDDFVGQLDGDESEDEDFNPEENDEDVKEEFDSNASSSTDEDEDGNKIPKKPKKPRKEDSPSEEEASEEGEEEDDVERRRKDRRAQKEKERKQKKKATAEPTQRGKRKQKAKKDPNAPKRPSSAYMLWLGDVRAKLKEENPSLSLGELMKVAGMEWKANTAEVKSKYEKQYLKDKEAYQIKIEEYKKSGSAAAFAASSDAASSSKPSRSRKTSSKPKPAAKAKSIPSQTGAYKSKEYIEDDDSSSDSDAPPPKPAPPAKKKKKEKEVVEVPADEDMPTESEAEDTSGSNSDESD